MEENKPKESAFSNKTEGEARKGKKGAKGEEGKDKESPEKDYWERVADDVASGYVSKEDENSILNIDQEAGDNESGDKATE
jgi:hypothetical protein